MKQTEVSLSSAESEVQALASTDVLADYRNTLRESLCLPTPGVELKCDNTAAIVLATGEGSWRTKSAANKVHAAKEKVENGRGQEQIRAIEHLSQIDLEKWLPRKVELVTKATGVKLSDCPGISRSAPGVFRVSAPGGFRVSFSDRPLRGFSGGFWTVFVRLEEKRRCHRKTTPCLFFRSNLGSAKQAF